MNPSSRPQSDVGDESTPATDQDTTSTFKKPLSTSSRPGIASTKSSTLFKPTAASTNASRPTATSTNRSIPSSLNKPPTRPTLASSVRNPSNVTPRSSTASVPRIKPVPVEEYSETVEYESRDDVGITAKPKRMSTISSLSTSTERADRSSTTSRALTTDKSDRSTLATSRITAPAERSDRSTVTSKNVAGERPNLTTTTSSRSVVAAEKTGRSTPMFARPTAPTIARRSSTATVTSQRSGVESPTTSRSNIASPTIMNKPGSLSQSASSGALRKQNTSNSLRSAATTQPEKKKLSTIQAPPLVRGNRSSQPRLANSDKGSSISTRTTRPYLNEDESAETSSVDIPFLRGDGDRFGLDDYNASSRASISGDHTIMEELNESRAYAIQLESQLEELNEKLREHSEQVEAQGDKSANTTEIGSSEQASILRDLSDKNQKRLDHLRNVHYEELKELREQHQHDLEEIRTTREADDAKLQKEVQSQIVTKDDELEQLRKQVNDLTQQSEVMSKTRDVDVQGTDGELQKLRQQIDVLTRQSEDATEASRIRDVVLAGKESELKTLTEKVDELTQQAGVTTKSKDKNLIVKEEEIAALRKQVDELTIQEEKIASQDKELQMRIQDAATKDVEIAELKSAVEAAKNVVPDTSGNDSRIAQLVTELEAARNVIPDTSGKDAEIARLRSEVQTLSGKGDEASVSAPREISPVKTDTEVTELRSKLAAIEKRHAAAKDNAKSKSARAQEEHATKLAAVVADHQTASAEYKNRSEQLQIELQQRSVEFENLKTKHDEELETLNKMVTTHEQEAETFKSDAAKDFQRHQAEVGASSTTIEELRKELAESQTAHEDSKKAAADALAAREVQSQRLEVSQGQLGSLRSELDDLKASSEKTTTEAITKLQSDVVVAREDLDRAKAGHEARTKELVEQLEQAQQQIEAQLQHDAKLQEAQEDLMSQLEQARTEFESARNDTTTMRKDLQAQLEQAKSDQVAVQADHTILLERAQTEATTATQLYENVKTDLEIQLQTAKKQLREIRTAMESTKDGHKSEMAASIASLKESHAKDQLSAKVTYGQRLTQLEKEKTTQLEELETANTIKIAEIQAEAEATKDAVLKEMSESHITALQDIGIKVQSLQQEMNETKTTHAAEIEGLTTTAAEKENALKDLLTQLEELNAIHSSEVEGLTGTLTAEKKAALEELRTQLDSAKTSHAMEIESLTTNTNEGDTVTKELRDQIETLKVSHATVLAGLATEYDSAKDEALKALQAEHTTKIAELEAQPRGMMDDELTTIKEGHTEELRKLQEENSNIQSHAQGMRFQLQTLKGILADSERQNTEKEKEHEEALQNVNNDFSRAVMRIAGFGSQMAAKDYEHTQALNAARIEIRAEHDKALEALKVEHSTSIEELQKKLADESNVLHESMKGEHQKALDVLQKGFDAKDADVEKLRVDHADALKTAGETSEAANKKAMERLTAEHSTALDTLRGGLESSHKATAESASLEQETQKAELHATIKALKEEHEVILAEIRSELTSYKTDLEGKSTELDDARSELDSFTSELAAARTKAINDTEKIDRSNTSLAEVRVAFLDTKKDHEGQLTTMTTTHAEELKNINAAHQEALNQLQQHVDDMQAAAEQSAQEPIQVPVPVRDTAFEDSLKKELQISEAQIDRLATDHADIWREAKSQNAKALKSLREQLAAAQEQIQEQNEIQSVDMEELRKMFEKSKTDGEKLSSAVIELKRRNGSIEIVNSKLTASLDKLRNSATNMTDKYNFAVSEAEKQSRRAATAENEVRDLQRVAASSSPNLSKLGTARGGLPESTVSSPKVPAPALGNSKWADDQSSTNSAIPTYPTVGLGIDRSESRNSNRSTGSKIRSERNVHGQLAGINEDIRNLNELSARMLAENQRMAKTLSRVDDETGEVGSMSGEE